MPGRFFDIMNKVQYEDEGKSLNQRFEEYHEARQKVLKDPDKNNKPAYENNYAYLGLVKS